jgi:hypothetical protein
MPVFLRWLLADIIIRRILRHRRIRPYVDRAYPLASQYTRRFGRRVYPTVAGGYQYARRRRLSGCSGCFLLVALMALGVVLLMVLFHWAM